MGKRARQQKRRAQKRKKRRVAFAEAAATKVIPASDPARAPQAWTAAAGEVGATGTLIGLARNVHELRV